MTDPATLKKPELLKLNSHQLRGTIADELRNDEPTFSGDAAGLLKHHGSYMQDDRDLRKAKNPDGSRKPKAYSCMVRTRIPGGRVTADQFLAEFELADRLANGTIRLTTRQGFQLHGVLKSNLQETIRLINESKLTTFAACGDVNRNVMCCPAPFRHDSVRDGMQELSEVLAEHFRPKTTSYFDIWLKDDDGNQESVADFQPVEEPIYGERYLPRKFKMAIALPEDNCVDIHTQDLGILVIAEDGQITGYNLLVGGGMGRTPSAEKTFPALSQPLAFVTRDQLIAAAEAVVKVQRDFGNREDRKIARLKYLIADWGIEKFRAKVEEYCGFALTAPRDVKVSEVEDHLGWHEQGDGRWFLGIHVENGRIADTPEVQMKTGLRRVIEQFRMPTRLTAMQSVLLCDIEAGDREAIDQRLTEYGIRPAAELSAVRRYAIACPAFPTCGLAITESERVMPEFLDALDAEMSRLGMSERRIIVRMTGCPNGCARPYNPEIGLVGRAVGKYSVFLGGNAEGSRLAFLYEDSVPLDEIVPTLSPVLQQWKDLGNDGEAFGDFCHRTGNEGLPHPA